jgi:hypothetical protein
MSPVATAPLSVSITTAGHVPAVPPSAVGVWSTAFMALSHTCARGAHASCHRAEPPRASSAWNSMVPPLWLSQCRGRRRVEADTLAVVCARTSNMSEKNGPGFVSPSPAPSPSPRHSVRSCASAGGAFLAA